MKKLIYLDFNATTPVDPRVLEAMLPYFSEQFGNSMSMAHSYGWDAEKAVQKARGQVAKLLNCQASEVYFTSGATESNNWALRGLFDQLQAENKNQKIEIISSSLEHNSVIKSLQNLEGLGAKVHYVKTSPTGEIDLNHLQSLINENTKLISIMWVNNEIGTINPVSEISEIARKNKIYFHSDATQAIGKLDIDLKQCPVDLVSFSAHKFYGPKGIGALVIKKHQPFVKIKPLLFGGGHEQGMRSGTLNVPGIVGLGEACEILFENSTLETVQLKKLQALFYNLLQNSFANLQLNGPEIGKRICNNLNITFRDHTVPSFFAQLALSKGSACQSGETSVSHVLKGIGLSPKDAENTLRLSLGRGTREEDIQQAVSELVKVIKNKQVFLNS